MFPQGHYAKPDICRPMVFRPLSGTRSRVGLFTITVLFLTLALTVAGCGGGDKDTQAQAEADPEVQRSHSMVPANIDSLIVETSPPAGIVSDIPAEENPVPQEMQASEQAPPVEEAGSQTATAAAEVGGAQAPVVTGSGAFSLQVGSFRKEDYAVKQAFQLQELGHAATVELADVGGLDYFRVFIRGLETRTDAENLGEDLRERLGINYLVLRKP